MPFAATVIDEDQLRSLYRRPAGPALSKQQDRLDGHARAFVAASPLVLLATTSPDGTVDVSPRGGPPGFVAVLDDHRLAIGDLAGNNRLDSLANIARGPDGCGGAGLLFVVPGLDETLRVQGRACLTTDPAVLDAATVDGCRPRLAVGVDVDEVFMHCAKAFRRGGVWDPATWAAVGDAARPSIGALVVDHCRLEDVTPEQVEAILEDSYASTLWEPGGRA